MIHLRIVAPQELATRALEALGGHDAVINVICLRGVALNPRGDVILCDVAHEDASVVLADLRELDIPRRGSIAIEEIDTALSAAATRAVRLAEGQPGDAVVWEEVEARTRDTASLSVTFLTFAVVAALITSVAIVVDSEVLLIGGMVVGPEFGPIAGFCVAAVQRRSGLAKRSALALTAGLLAAAAASALAGLVLLATGTIEKVSGEGDLATLIANPDALSVVVALTAGVAGMLSLSTQKSGALIGVLVSVTTLPAASYAGLAAAYGNWEAARGSLTQLVTNLVCIFAAGLATLGLQRLLYERRRERHLRER
ncbi:MAG: DUF389 domain-containing protein [Solirubrobacteraceae bacterium MAG38_C4-C5]|nr:DUF389 domain-containing protein [Candidatus Siliceabacter maunaloa]